jgi:uncharacterized membrane protein
LARDVPNRTVNSTARDAAVPAEIDRLIRSRQEARRKPVPGWVSVAMRVLPHVLITVTIVNLFIGVLAALTPLLGAWFGSAVTDPIYNAYSLICPQRHDHTFHMEGHAMAFEQRDLAMHIGFGIVGLLYLRVRQLRSPLPTWLFIAGVAPLLIDVALSTAGILPSTWFSRSWTGVLASWVIVWWSYPRFERYLEKVRRHVQALDHREQLSQPGRA